METVEKTTEAKGAFAQIGEYLSGFKVLKECPGRYWGLQAVNVLDCAAYFGLLTVFVLYLSKNVGYSNVGAGYMYTLFGIASGIALMTFSGPLTDWLGVRKASLLAVVGKVISGGAIPLIVAYGPFDGSKELIAGLLVVLGVCNAMMQTVYQLGNAKFSTKKARAAAFNFWYMFMNVGAFAGGMAVEGFLAAKMNYNVIVMFCAALNFLSLFVLLGTVRSNEEVEKQEKEKEKEKKKRNPMEIFWSVVRQSTFWKLIVLVTLFVPVRAVFLYMSAIMPKYWVQVVGEDAPIGFFSSINPFLIVIGIIVIVPIIGKLNIFKVLTYGAMVSAASLFVLVLPWNWFSTDMAKGYYAMTVVSMIVLSAGEMFWSPKLQHITEVVAPKAEVATYLGISTATWFIAKTLAGGLSGHMINRWCPNGIGPKIAAGTVAFSDSPEMLWLILGIAAIAGPIIAIFIKGWLFKGIDLNKAGASE